MQIGQTLPELAKVTSELAIIRSMYTETGDHEGGRYFLRTSYKEIASIRHPGMGAWALKILGRQNRTLPDNVLIGSEARHPGAGFLEPAFTSSSAVPSGSKRRAAEHGHAQVFD